MTTTRQLWLGFGALTVVLLLSGLATLFQVLSIERTLKEQTEVARPRSVATRELRASVIGFCLDVWAFAQNADPQFRALAEAEANDVTRHLAEYERLATTARQRELAGRFVALWRPCEALGRAILVAPVGPLRAEDSRQLGQRRTALQDFLADEMQPDAVAEFETRGDENLQHVRAIVSLALVLLIAGLAIAIATSVTVGRSIVRTERAIAEQSERLRTTLASIGDAVITTDTAGRITNMNGVAATLTGWTNEQALGQPLEAVFRIVHETTRQPVENPAAKALREGAVIGPANHTVLVARDGSERSIDDSAAPIRCKVGEVVGCVLIFRDISEQRRAARAIAASEARKHAILDAALDCIVTIDHQGRILEFNQAAERTFGHRLADVRGRELADVMIPSALRDAHRTGLARYLATGQSTLLDRRIELNALGADGAEFPVELAVTAIPGEGHPVFTAYLRDITERKHGEQAAADRIRYATLDAEIGFALAGKDSLQGMLQACAESLVRNLDGAFVRIWTLAEGDVLALQASAGLSGIDARFDARYDRVPIGHGAIGLLAAVRKPHLSNDVAGDPGVPEPDWAKKEGMLAFAGYPLIVNDRLVGALALFARHRLGESALAAIASAARGIALGIERKEMEDRLRQFVAQLSEADRKKDEFLATLAHELRNPMAPIRNGLQLMRLAGAKPAAIEQARAMMERQLAQLVRLVDDLMDVSRITRGRLELRKEQVLLTTVVNSAIEASQALIEERGHELTVSLPSQPITLDADPTRLTQVLLNLLGNAAKYSDPGGHIWLTAERQGRELVLSVRDAGIGIAAEHLPHIFDLFAQVDRSLERSQSGLGIGLTLVKRLVEMHGGRVEAKSEGPGKGSEFVAWLPIVVLSMGKPGAVGSDAANPSSSLRILVVDDNCDGADSLAMMLRLVGNDVRTAYDGEQGVAEVESFRPDVVLLDIGLPKINGYEACRLIRDQPWGRSLVAVAVTGWGQERDIRRSREAGFDHHMVKPVDPATLLQLLAELQVQRTEPPPAP